MSTSIPGASVHPGIVAAIERAAQWLSQAGYAVEAVEPPDMAEAARLWQLIVDNEARIAMGPLIEKLGDPAIRTAFAAMTRNTPVLDTAAYFRALARRTALIRNWNAFLERYPLVLGPLSAEPPFTQGLDVQSPASMDRIISAQGPQFAVPLLGLPAVCAPGTCFRYAHTNFLLLGQVVTAVNGDIRSSDVVAAVGLQKRQQVAQLVHLAESAQGNLVGRGRTDVGLWNGG
jgi:Asp-tRNA(Asn)/Glu-tRNA(Gln) amidotransferase A subunit family amidase